MTITDTIYNGMLHTSTILPAPLSAGPTNSPDNTKCWHCHTHTNGTVTSLQQRQVPRRAHQLPRDAQRARSSPYPQPTTNCSDCHSYMMPDGIVELKGSDLWPMDHKAVLATADHGRRRDGGARVGSRLLVLPQSARATPGPTESSTPACR